MPFISLNLFAKAARKDFNVDLKIKEPSLFHVDVILWKLFGSILIRGL